MATIDFCVRVWFDLSNDSVVLGQLSWAPRDHNHEARGQRDTVCIGLEL